MAGPGVQLIATQIEEAGGMDTIEGLQQHRDMDIYRLAYGIIDKYFGSEVHCMLTTITQFSTIISPAPPFSQDIEDSSDKSDDTQ